MSSSCRRRRRHGVCSALRSVCLLGVTLVLTSCRWITTGSPSQLAAVPADVRPKRVVLCEPAACTDSLDIVAMGVSGFLLVPWQDTTGLVLSPPAFRHPSLWRLLFADWLIGTRADSAQLRRRLAAMPNAGPTRMQRVRGVLVGHGHYDHLLDLPQLAHFMPNARIYGSASVYNTLHGEAALRDSLAGEPRLVNIEPRAGSSASTPGDWLMVPQTPFRFKAAVWEHAHNIARFTFSPGAERVPRTTLPRTASGWKAGRTFAYALDLVAPNGEVSLRVVLHDAAATSPAIQRASDAWGPTTAPTVAIISAANFDQVADYPDALISTLRPAHIVLGHWEDFFRSPEKPPRVVRGISARKLLQRLTPVGDIWSALEPGATLRIVLARPSTR